MPWLYVPGLTASPYTPGMADSKPPSISYCPDIAPYVLSNGKLTPRPPSWDGWKKRAWARVLCGMTLPPSTLSRGVDSWISSLRASRASHTAQPGKVFEKVTRAMDGLTSSGLCAHLCRRSFGGKTSQLSLPGVGTPSSLTWKAWVTELRRESAARQKLARRIFANGSLFSERWPTATVHGNHNRKGVSPKAGDGLATAVNWPTPADCQALQGQNDPDGKRGQTLIGATRGQSWPTPRATDGPNQRGSKGDLMLPSAVQEFWQTPAAALTTSGQTSRGGDRKEELLLAGQAKWGTPTARNYKAGRGREGQLTSHLQVGRGPQGAEPNNTHGKSPGSLNPEWVEQLMGWAPGMSSFSTSATEWSRWLERWRLWLFGKN